MMQNTIEELLWFLPWLFNYLPLISFLAPIIGGGELGVIAVAFIFSRSFISFLTVIIFTFLGTMTIDSIWFGFSRSGIFKKMKKFRMVSKQYKKIESRIQKISHNNDVLIISFAKLMIGTRIMLMIYLGGRTISFRRFLLYNSIPSFIWCIILATIGWMAARGFSYIISIFKNVQLAITFLIVLFVVFYILQKWINKKLTGKQEL